MNNTSRRVCFMANSRINFPRGKMGLGNNLKKRYRGRGWQ